MQEDKKVVEVENYENVNAPTLEKGNYIIEIEDENGLIKKVAVANASINITRLKDGGLTVDL